jgi:lipopolysaccharide export system permease protein
MTSGLPLPQQKSFNLFSWLPFGSVMDRYIIRELFMPFLFGVGAFSSIGVAVGVLFELVRRITEAGLPLSVALQVFLLKLPYFVSLAFPMSILLACLMVYGRLSSDSELIALRSSGISVYRIVVPALILSLIVTGITFVFNEAVVPAANYQAGQTLNQALKRNRPGFRDRNIVYQEYRKEVDEDGDKQNRLTRIFYASEFNGKEMEGLTILDFSRQGLNQIVASEKASWNEDQKTWDFYNGTIYLVAPDGSYRNILRFDHQQLQLPRTPLDVARTTRDDTEMNIAELGREIKLVEQTGNTKKMRRLIVRREQKYAFPFACLLFGLIGSSLGIRPQRSGRRATGFGLSLIIIMVYYILISVCEALYNLDFLSAGLAAWLPNIIGFLAGLFLLNRLNR